MTAADINSLGKTEQASLTNDLSTNPKAQICDTLS